MKRFFKSVLLFAIVLMIAFIWSNSLKTAPESQKQSDQTKEVVENVLTDNGQQALTPNDTWILDNIRKIAHFVEFAVLSGLIGLYILGFSGGNRQYYWMMTVTLLVAAVDETIQIFTGRGPSVWDVLLDCCGGVTGYLMIFIAVWMAKMIYFEISQKTGFSVIEINF